MNFNRRTARPKLENDYESQELASLPQGPPPRLSHCAPQGPCICDQQNPAAL